ncbi:CRISPR-associated helicase Cas3' [uncultured Desulfovibrio sp.]|uniref:CRISPR-associated helicase Cas3' n=1 Tax=uncultured Desulfovibrio sp. TaxID=167968 RepID=UPI002610E006|nr:CRISPR-associated helicase Cas3' [uncultured Desulfovibrio sp.]
MKAPHTATAATSPPVPALPPERCLAKTRTLTDGCAAGRTVEDHCRIAGAVAACLAARLEAVVPGLLPPGADIPARLHDVGKVYPPFQAKLYEKITGDAWRQMPELARADMVQEERIGGHAAVSRACLAALGAPAVLARIVGAHHARTISDIAESALNGGPHWRELRHQICRRLLGESTRWPDIAPRHERMLCGLTITADWIASGPLFDDPAEDWHPLVERAVDEAGFCWPRVRPGLSFADIFSFDPRPAQTALYEAVSGPGVFVLEAPMGMGKTEAALYAAYRLLAQGKACGLYFALPTRLTSNRIHARVDAFLERILDGGGTAMLLHGQAWLERFRQQRMGEEAAPGQAWFSVGRRGILAPFGVGTVDQALLSALNVRFGALRTFGLAGKVVILDEVHSYDAYTGTILDALTAQLREQGCTVIILSATLTARRRASLLPGATAGADAYPLISAAPNDAPAREIPCAGGATAEVALSHPSEEDAVEEALERAERGERVLWLENTVAEAQERYRLLAARAAAMPGLAVGLLHSRFTPADRERQETRWTGFLHPAAPQRGTAGGIVVATQVAEQSLDLDADLLISRFCPTDMLFQRLGRLWRHGERTPRPAAARRRACLLHPGLTEAVERPKAAFGLSGHVYAPYVLLRSLEVWQGRGSVRLPEDIRPLLEATYAEREETLPAVTAVRRELMERRDMLRRLAQLGQSTTIKIIEEDNVPTRWQEREETDVLLYRRWDAAARRLLLADGSELTLPPLPDLSTREERLARWQVKREVALALARNSVRMPRDAAPRDVAGWLQGWLWNARAARMAEDGSLRHEDGSPLPRPARYDEELGYSLRKKEAR